MSVHNVTVSFNASKFECSRVASTFQLRLDAFIQLSQPVHRGEVCLEQEPCGLLQVDRDLPLRLFVLQICQCRSNASLYCFQRRGCLCLLEWYGEIDAVVFRFDGDILSDFW